MSQRGGSVESTCASRRMARSTRHDSDGEVDVLLGFELLEALRGLPQVKPEGAIVVDPRRIVPMTVSIGLGSTRERPGAPAAKRPQGARDTGLR